MEYLYENLGDERFQEFCQSLINREFRNTQAFPVGQPDGGRDYLSYFMSSTIKEFIVFQVKYVKNPNSIQDVHRWLTSIIDKEADKIQKLIPKGAKSYYLITNVKGTAHLENGSIDKVNEILESKINIPAICWWRDDLSRKMDGDPMLKWAFPEILLGQDILNNLLFQYINENKDRRENVIKSYLADQYRIDNEVKFRQIDLQNRLLDLFTDVPIRIKKYNEKNKSLRQCLGILEGFHVRMSTPDGGAILEERPRIGAAEFLIHPQIQTDIQKVLLEGGPGQGKSTIAQYVCQVHRIRLLNKFEDLKLIPDSMKNVPIRLPFKIDLRHIAAWLENRNPYQGILSDDYFSKIWQKSLEAFLVGHIFYHSKLENFDSNDFIAVCKSSSILFVFDGFDEIANLKVREEVIEFINKGINRITENSKSVQVLITSRPAAFSDTIGFSVDMYPHFELGDVTPEITKEYVEKWIRASRLDSGEANEIKRLVEEKLEMPHLKELAKSPMQLAIFLSLLRTKGESLPNKRTALYDSYIELFFDRESEKNSTIRDNRDLVIDIHKYLGWILHSEAELYRNSGSIQIDDLKNRLKGYLLQEGHQTDITDKLFDVVKERVCALASRVQGTFEFEVQPLREYFCAKYLYSTSPYSPTGSEKSGTKPDRFEAIARNYYWQNVVRFFAGCFDKGELPMLIQKLRELQEDVYLKYTNYPRIITSQLLADWVFTQYPILLKEVVQIIIDGINIGSILNQDQDRRTSSNEFIQLPLGCGRIEVVEECFMQLRKFPKNDYAAELIGLIKNNQYKTVHYWQNYLDEIDGEQLTIWLEYAYMLQIIHKIDKNVLVKIAYKNEKEMKTRLQTILNGNQFEIIENDEHLKQIVFRGILDNELHIRPQRNFSSSLNFLFSCFNPFHLSMILNKNEMSISFENFLKRRLYRYGYSENEFPVLITEFKVVDRIDTQIQTFINSISTVLESDLSEWPKSIEHWDNLVENARIIFGNCMSLNIISVIAAGIKSKTETYEDYENLNDQNISLCKRVRCARMKSGNIIYWERQLLNSNTPDFTLLVFLTWATAKTISKLVDRLSQLINSLNLVDFTRLVDAVKKVAHISTFSKSDQKLIESEINKKQVSDLLKYILSFRFSDENKTKFIYKNMGEYSGDIQDILVLRLNFIISQFVLNPTDTTVLDEIKQVYSRIKKFDPRRYYHTAAYERNSPNIPIEIAEEIMKDCKNYPRIVASLAEKSCRMYSHKQLKPVGEIAKSNKWFDDI